MQGIEDKGVAGEASWKLLKIRVQICKDCCRPKLLPGCKGSAGIKRVAQANIKGEKSKVYRQAKPVYHKIKFRQGKL